MESILKILFVEDIPGDAELMWHELKKNKIAFTKILVDNRDDYIDTLDKFEPDIIISDYLLPQFNGMSALLLRNEKAPLTPFIIVTGSINEEVAVECMKAGADDYVLKDKLSHLGPSVITSINKIKLLKEKKDAEDELRKSEMRLQTAQSIAHVGDWELDLSTKTILCSDEALRIYGYENMGHEIPLQLVQKSPLPEYREMLDDTLDRLLKYNELYEAEFKIRQVNTGEIKLVYSKAELVLIHNTKQVKVIGVIQDITKRKRDEETLQQSHAFNESLLKTIPFGMDIVDEKGNILFQSENFEKLFGKEGIGKKCWDLYCDDKIQCSDCPLMNGITIGETGTYESRGFLGNRIFEIIHTGMTYQGKKAMLEIFQDITERKITEEEYIKAKFKAEESDRLKTAFLHNISHEIRTPMNAIVGFSALLSEPEVDEQTRQSYIDVIIQSSNHLLAIITDIVDISNIQANLVKVVKNEININSTFKTIFNQFLPKADEKNLILTFETDLDNRSAFILADSTKLFQILSNLVNNAIKFTNEGNVKLRYRVRGNFLEFCVTDTGIGIPKDHYDRIFDRFYQVQNIISRVYEGTGLGLSISKAYVELLGGRMWLSSELGKGSSFFFTIPYEKRVVLTKAVVESDISADFVFPEEKTILVAEDIDSNFKLVKYFLSRSNVKILRATNGKEAVEKALSGKNIDLVLMDIKMPVMDGYTAVKLIRETNSVIPIIAQTAYADDKERAIECGCSGFISKPFDKKGLIKILREFI